MLVPSSRCLAEGNRIYCNNGLRFEGGFSGDVGFFIVEGSVGNFGQGRARGVSGGGDEHVTWIFVIDGLEVGEIGDGVVVEPSPRKPTVHRPYSAKTLHLPRDNHGNGYNTS